MTSVIDVTRGVLMEPAAGVFPLPQDLADRAAGLLDRERRSDERRRLRKRFVRGVAGDDLAGFFLNEQPLLAADVPPSLRRPAPDVDSQEPGRMPPQPADDDRDWLQLSADLHAQVTTSLMNDRLFRRVLDQYRDRDHIPDWMSAFASDHGSRVIDVRRARAFRKSSSAVEIQSRHYSNVLERRPELARYFVPLIGFELDDHRQLCVMPFLADFVTLHDLLAMAAGLIELPDSPISPHEVPEILPAVAAELGVIFSNSLAMEESSGLPWIEIQRRLEERFDSSHETPILIGDQLLKTSAERATAMMRNRLEPLWTATTDLEMDFGHGDLNATNVMVAAQRNDAGGIESVCVRLIDANPESVPGHTLLELARLIHWIELGLPLQLSRAADQPLIQAQFTGSVHEEAFMNRAPRLWLEASTRAALSPVYERFLTDLCAGIPALRSDPGQQLLSLGVSFYHLVATRYWPRNIDRSVAFWTGINELERLAGRPRPGRDNGLSAVRRKVCG